MMVKTERSYLYLRVVSENALESTSSGILGLDLSMIESRERGREEVSPGKELLKELGGWARRVESIYGAVTVESQEVIDPKTDRDGTDGQIPTHIPSLPLPLLKPK